MIIRGNMYLFKGDFSAMVTIKEQSPEIIQYWNDYSKVWIDKLMGRAV